MSIEVPIIAVAAIPATLLIVSQTVQGTAQSLDAVGIEGDEARNRISLMAIATGVALVLAALVSKKPEAVISVAATAALTIYAFHRITL